MGNSTTKSTSPWLLAQLDTPYADIQAVSVIGTITRSFTTDPYRAQNAQNVSVWISPTGSGDPVAGFPGALLCGARMQVVVYSSDSTFAPCPPYTAAAEGLMRYVAVARFAASRTLLVLQELAVWRAGGCGRRRTHACLPRRG